MKQIIPFVIAILMSTSAFANEPIVTKVTVSKASPYGARNFDVTIKHNDEGWEHFADKFEILSPNDDLLGTRVLAHPHVKEQPFTRSKNGVKIPKGLKQVKVRAHDSVHGYGPSITVDLP